MLYGRAFWCAADGLFAWTVLLRLRGDDGQREVVIQSWPVLPVLTGVSAHVFSWAVWKCTCSTAAGSVCVYLYPNGGVVGLFSEGGSPFIPPSTFCEYVSSAAPQGPTAPINQLNSAPKGEGIVVLVQTWPESQRKSKLRPWTLVSPCMSPIKATSENQ